jgi:hypothetical protein
MRNSLFVRRCVSHGCSPDKEGCKPFIAYVRAIFKGEEEPTLRVYWCARAALQRLPTSCHAVAAKTLRSRVVCARSAVRALTRGATAARRLYRPEESYRRPGGGKKGGKAGETWREEADLKEARTHAAASV